MFLEFLYHFLSFDLNWLIRFVFDPHSLMWLFLMFAVASFFYSKKLVLWGTAFFILFNWVFLDISIVSNFAIPFGMLAVVFIYNVFAQHWLFGDKDWDKYAVKIGVVAVFSIWFVMWFLQG